VKISVKTSNPPRSRARKLRDHRLDLVGVVARRAFRRDREGRCCVLDGAHHQPGIGGGYRIVQDSHARDRRGNLRQHLQPLAGHQRVEVAEAGDIAAGMREVFDEALAHGIGDHCKHDRGRAGFPPQRHDGRAGLCKKHVWTELNQFRRVAIEQRGVAPGPAPVNAQIFTRPPAQRAEALHQGSRVGLPHGVVGKISHQHAEA
jgi:hypothetical protein